MDIEIIQASGIALVSIGLYWQVNRPKINKRSSSIKIKKEETKFNQPIQEEKKSQEKTNQPNNESIWTVSGIKLETPSTKTTNNEKNNYLKSPNERMAEIKDKGPATYKVFNDNFSPPPKEPQKEKSKKTQDSSSKKPNTTESSTKPNITNFPAAACEEFKSLGFKKDINTETLEESYNISKQPDGQWFKCYKLGFHPIKGRHYLNLAKMPILKKITSAIDRCDSEFAVKGGRIFIAENEVYKIKNSKKFVYTFKNRAPQNETPNLVMRAFNELGLYGYKNEIDPADTFSLSKDTKGDWFKCNRKGNHPIDERDYLDLKIMPGLKALTDVVDFSYPEFKFSGGRIFITKKYVYQIKDKTKIILELNQNNLKKLDKKMQLLERAIKGSSIISFSYVDNHGNSTTRTLLPFKYYKNSEVLYLEGFCYLRSDKRTFKIDKMTEVKLS